MKFGYTIVYVRDVTKTVAFYEAALGLKRKFIHESGQYAEMNTGDTTLAFSEYEIAKQNEIDVQKPDKSKSPPAFEIVLLSHDVEGAYKKAVANGAQALKPPAEKPWGQTVSYVKDINGYLIEIASPIGE